MSEGWLNRVLDFIYPPTCVLCGAAGDGRDLCAGCRDDLPLNTKPCPRCALPLAGEAALCGECLLTPPPWDSACVPFHYAYPVDQMLQRLKFHGKLAEGRVLGELMGIELAHLADLPELLIPVPLHRRREALRGFNQASELALPLSRRLRVPIAARTCRRVRATAEQSGLGAAERRRNVRGAFALARPLTARHVAIVDDVVTTGGTAAELAKTLRRAGAERVDLWGCARAASPIRPPRRR